MLSQVSLANFAMQLEQDVHPGDLAQRGGQNFWTLNKNKSAGPASPQLQQYARIRYLQKTGKFWIKTRGNVICQGILKHGRVPAGKRWSERVPGLISDVWTWLVAKRA